MIWVSPFPFCSGFVTQNKFRCVSVRPRRKFRVTLRGERSGSGRLPELRRFWICSEACRLERQVGRHRVYPYEVSRLRGYWPETPDLTEDRRLTARPAVLAKRTDSRTVPHFPSYNRRSGPHENSPTPLLLLPRTSRQSQPPWLWIAAARAPSRPGSFRSVSHDIKLCRPSSEPSPDLTFPWRGWQPRCSR